MARRLTGGRLVIASHNEGKLREIADLLRPYGMDTVSAGSLNIPEPEETGTSFAENAAIKARAVAKASGLPALSDDSGVCVKALGGWPGIYSARIAGEPRDFGKAMEAVEAELHKVGATGPNERRAWFTCALALGWPDGETAIFEGQVDGTLVWPPRGTMGFGYDPMFQPDGYGITFGEMDPERKHRLSHRAKAFAQLIAACFQQ